MKKIYNVPATTVVALEIKSHLLDASKPQVSVNTTEGSVDAGSVETRQHQGVGSGLWSDMK